MKQNLIHQTVEKVFKFSSKNDKNSFISSQGVLLSRAPTLDPQKSPATNSPKTEEDQMLKEQRRRNVKAMYSGDCQNFDEVVNKVQQEIEIHESPRNVENLEIFESSSSSFENSAKTKTLETMYLHQIEKDKKQKQETMRADKILKLMKDYQVIYLGKSSVEGNNLKGLVEMCENFYQYLNDEVNISRNLKNQIDQLELVIEELKRCQKNGNSADSIYYQREIEKLTFSFEQRTQKLKLEFENRLKLTNQQEINMRNELNHELEEERKNLRELKENYAKDLQILTNSHQEEMRNLKEQANGNEWKEMKEKLEKNHKISLHQHIESKNKSIEELTKRNEFQISKLTNLFHDKENCYKNEIELLKSQLEQLNSASERFNQEKIQLLKNEHYNQIESMKLIMEEKTSQVKNLEDIIHRKLNSSKEHFDKMNQFHLLEMDEILQQKSNIEVIYENKLKEKTLQLEAKIKELEANNKVLKEKETSLKDWNQNQMKIELESINHSLRVKISELERELEISRSKNQKAVFFVPNEFQRDHEILQENFEKLKEKFDQSEKQNESLRKEIQKKDSENYQEKIESYKEQLKFQIEKSRILQNKLMETNGNIQVICRIKPPTNTNKKTQEFIELSPEDDSIIKIIENVQNPIGGTSLAKKHLFSFNKVFPPESTQKQVFFEVSPFIESALDGHHVCIFAYGQTGSGKTHTMIGSDNKSENQGMIYQSIHQIFQQLKHLNSNCFSVESNFIEVYNDKIYDLMNMESDLKYEIRHEEDGRTEITNLKKFKINSVDEFTRLLDRATKNRTKGATKSHERSSRSHAIIRLKISVTNEEMKMKTEGILNLIDLSGSERFYNTEAFEERINETKHINKSLTNLG
jgi:kinesin family member C1